MSPDKGRQSLLPAGGQKNEAKSIIKMKWDKGIKVHFILSKMRGVLIWIFCIEAKDCSLKAVTVSRWSY